MKSQTRYEQTLPLENPNRFTRNLFIDSCRLDDEHYQVRGELSDNRADYEDPEQEIPIHGMAARLTIRLEDNRIVKAEFAMPRGAFAEVCDRLPVGPEALEGLRAGGGLGQKIREIYGGDRSCWHLTSLLTAMVSALPQCWTWNGSFMRMDESLPPQHVPAAMAAMQSKAVNTCHAWDEKEGWIVKGFREGDYGPMLNRMAPRLLRRWREWKKGDAE